MDSTIYLQIERPRPVPLGFICSFSFSLLKSMNKFYKPFSEIPVPLSHTLSMISISCFKYSLNELYGTIERLSILLFSLG